MEVPFRYTDASVSIKREPERSSDMWTLHFQPAMCKRLWSSLLKMITHSSVIFFMNNELFILSNIISCNYKCYFHGVGFVFELTSFLIFFYIVNSKKLVDINMKHPCVQNFRCEVTNFWVWWSGVNPVNSILGLLWWPGVNVSAASIPA